ncbi:GSCOCG00011735001-RA-CDS [Cotesia congregata]|nr:GSCOCG00011735001-RA-CDS [Cotesia congregata]
MLLLNIYKSLIRSQLEYGCHIFNTSNHTQMDKLNKIQNAGMRFAIGARISTPINSLTAETGLTPIKLRFDELTNRYILKAFSLENSTITQELDKLSDILNKKKRSPNLQC